MSATTKLRQRLDPDTPRLFNEPEPVSPKLIDLALHAGPQTRAVIAENPNLPRWVLERLSKDPSCLVRGMVAKNPSTSPNTLIKLLCDGDPLVQNAAAKTARSRDSKLLQLAVSLAHLHRGDPEGLLEDVEALL